MGDDEEVTRLKGLLAKAQKATGDEFMAVYKFGKTGAQATPAANDSSYPQAFTTLRKRHFGLAIALTFLLLSSKWNVSTSVKIEISAKYEVTVNQADFPPLPSTAGLIPLPVPNQAECQVPCRFTLAGLCA
ncbi:hypothetical protein [Undibacterium sp. Ren11W]|uniref:hypothetical protein n=1 Tax=Undibacterium sp. Ren11W TaxID=3413045 RepID=UPI003BF3CB41